MPGMTREPYRYRSRDGGMIATSCSRTPTISRLISARRSVDSRAGAGRELLSGAEERAYVNRAAPLMPPDLLAWLHRSPNDDPAV